MKILIIATGLGIVQRGFETSALQWMRALREHPGIELRLLAGGQHPEATKIFCISQTGKVASLLRRIGVIKDGARLQQRTSVLAVKRQIKEYRPDFVWLQEGTLAVSLQRWIHKKKLPTKIAFCNGAPIATQICQEFDLVIDLIPTSQNSLLSSGYDPSRAKVIPYPCLISPVRESRTDWRSKYGYADGDRIIMSAAAWNSHHKRIDYVIREFANASGKDPTLRLLLCGQPTQETERLQAIAKSLCDGKVTWLTLHADEMGDAYRASDLFVLASHNEAFGAVIPEAIIAGLPVLCNDFPSAHFLLGESNPSIIDMTTEGALAAALLDPRRFIPRPGLKEHAVDRFSHENLANELIQFLELHRSSASNDAAA